MTTTNKPIKISRAASTNDAGSATVGDAGEFIVDGFPLKQSFIIYKEK